MKKGFTLVEVFIVIIIIAMLAGIAIPSFMETKKKRERAERYGYNVERTTDRDDHIVSVDRRVTAPYECSQILDIDGVKIYRFREKDSSTPYSYVAIGNSPGSPVSMK